jgi:phosphatidate cytidylyltransferase
LKQRILTGVIGGAAFLTFLMLGGIWFTSLIFILASIAYYEFVKMSKIRFISIPSLIGFIYIAIILSSAFHIEVSKSLFDFNQNNVFISLIFILMLLIVFSKNHFTIEQAGVLFISVVYIGFGFLYFIETRIDQGLSTIIFILIVIWCTDSAAYFIGKKFGKNKLWPSISPNKTMEGSMGGVIIAVIGGLLFQVITQNFESWTQVVVLSVIISIVGQLGDLVESALKRHFEVKDSGALLPGHGGVLDRFDSLLFVFPILYLLQLL